MKRTMKSPAFVARALFCSGKNLKRPDHGDGPRGWSRGTLWKWPDAPGTVPKIDVGCRRSEVASLRNAPGTVPGAFLKFMQDVHNLCRIFQGCISENLIKKAGGEPAFPSPVLWCQNTHIKLLGL
jgi:hypothetical protein